MSHIDIGILKDKFIIYTFNWNILVTSRRMKQTDKRFVHVSFRRRQVLCLKLHITCSKSVPQHD